ncbi:hypothetical protein M413DRAFT_442101 [Hebeloma cylindrosporum]|uniref:Uncharacterized protein n=1 Tax=Hebeloma cylindrosporum TaxID=76867 RepID=A0A0C2YWP2_HEBCY|nr:hypothetical protein M413DRAFT_442101 [Hebeloma cylindrosporum h7]
MSELPPPSSYNNNSARMLRQNEAVSNVAQTSLSLWNPGHNARMEQDESPNEPSITLVGLTDSHR